LRTAYRARLLPGHRISMRAGCIAAAWRRALRGRRARRRAAAARVIQAAARGAAVRRRAALLRARAAPLAAASSSAASPVPLPPSAPLARPGRGGRSASPAVAGRVVTDDVADTGMADSAVEPSRCDTKDLHLHCRMQATQTRCNAEEPRLDPSIHAAPRGCDVQALLQSVPPRVPQPCAASGHAPGSDSPRITPDASAQPQLGGSAQLGAPAQGLAGSSAPADTTASASSQGRGSHGMPECARAASGAGDLDTHGCQCGPTAAATKQASRSAADHSRMTTGEPNAACTHSPAGGRAARLPCTHAGQSVAGMHCNPVHPGHAALANNPAAAPALIALKEMDSERDRERQEAVLPCADGRDSIDTPESPRCSADS
jgi:hypothetical protein